MGEVCNSVSVYRELTAGKHQNLGNGETYFYFTIFVP